MRHLTVDEMLDFVSLEELNEESIAYAAAVNSHTRKCEKCRRAVCAFQEIYDKFVQYSADGSFKDFVSKSISKRKINAISEQDEMEGFR